ncbi:MAG: SH3 domain-containing protein [Thermodesulfobacterium sp.]|nr:SH3 domain-containing protein [Thermodesulfobacterium sp.]
MIKLIEKYYELSQRVERLERQLGVEKKEKESGIKEEGKDGIKEKYQLQARLRVRSCPRTRCSIVAVLEKGTVVSLLSRKGKWAFIETSDGVKGWVESKHLQEYSY